MMLPEPESALVITTAEALPAPFIAVYEYWSNLMVPPAIMPRHESFRLDDLASRLIPWSVLVDVSTDQTEFVFRFWGTERARLIGAELTGKTTEDIPTSFMRDANIAEYRDVVAQKRPMLCKTPVTTKSGRQAIFQSIRLPLADERGTVARVFSAMDYEQISDASYEFFGTQIFGR